MHSFSIKCIFIEELVHTRELTITETVEVILVITNIVILGQLWWFNASVEVFAN